MKKIRILFAHPESDMEEIEKAWIGGNPETSIINQRNQL
jgi:hypothetical protein